MEGTLTLIMKLGLIRRSFETIMRIFGLIYKKEGQTLIEAIMALAVAMLVISALAILATTSSNDAKFAENKSIANNLLSQSMNKIRTVRDQQTWDTGSSSFASKSYTASGTDCAVGGVCACYKRVDVINWVMGSSYNCPTNVDGFSYSTCSSSSGAADYIDNPSGSAGNQFFCERIELKENLNGTGSPDPDSRIIDVSIAWVDGAGDHKINSSTILTKWH